MWANMLRRTWFCFGTHAGNKIMSSDKVDTIAARIIKYLRNSPQAADTVEGITQWWLSSSADSQPDVVEALRSLQAKGIVVCTNSLIGGAGIWRLSDSREEKSGTQQELPADKGANRRLRQ
jgi:hypothetical protein